LQQSRKFRVKKCNKTIQDVFFGEFHSHLLSNLVRNIASAAVRNNHFSSLSLSPRSLSSPCIVCVFLFAFLKFIKLREFEIDTHTHVAYAAARLSCETFYFLEREKWEICEYLARARSLALSLSNSSSREKDKEGSHRSFLLGVKNSSRVKFRMSQCFHTMFLLARRDGRRRRT
jgi:hypothetical protein